MIPRRLLIVLTVQCNSSFFSSWKEKKEEEGKQVYNEMVTFDPL